MNLNKNVTIDELRDLIQSADDAAGGPGPLAAQPYWPNINSRLDPDSITTEPFTIFTPWRVPTR